MVALKSDDRVMCSPLLRVLNSCELYSPLPSWSIQGKRVKLIHRVKQRSCLSYHSLFSEALSKLLRLMRDGAAISATFLNLRPLLARPDTPMRVLVMRMLLDVRWSIELRLTGVFEIPRL